MGGPEFNPQDTKGTTITFIGIANHIKNVLTLTSSHQALTIKGAGSHVWALHHSCSLTGIQRPVLLSLFFSHLKPFLRQYFHRTSFEDRFSWFPLFYLNSWGHLSRINNSGLFYFAAIMQGRIQPNSLISEELFTLRPIAGPFQHVGIFSFIAFRISSALASLHLYYLQNFRRLERLFLFF